MKLHDLKPAEGSNKRRKRIGCGIGSGHGKTSCRGHKGQRSRGRSTLKPWFEGGQLPLSRRLPKKGFNHTQRHPVEHVNLDDLAQLPEGSEVTPVMLCEMGLVNGRKGAHVKILARGDISVALKICVHALSQTAREKILAAGGTIEEPPC
jgi:large subunit ribosomal protein L15